MVSHIKETRRSLVKETLPSSAGYTGPCFFKYCSVTSISRVSEDKKEYTSVQYELLLLSGEHVSRRQKRDTCVSAIPIAALLSDLTGILVHMYCIKS